MSGYDLLDTRPRRARRGTSFGRTLLDWGLGPLIPSDSLVVSELATNSTIHAGTHITVSVSSNLGALRLSVGDHSPDLPHQRHSQQQVHGRGLLVIAGLSRGVGVLPTGGGGKVVWAVLNAALPRHT